ncbi:MAG: hypothetical protein US49_C0006G0021 [candidate division TM6 bacterium GW2011_GWF2_37_49]|nr:MAG: hypothetical protein US49_C0006G0021 [candidate division TM6 bacterium GW2011_GWF2_37_49]
MKKSLIDNKLSLNSTVLFNWLVFLCATNLCLQPDLIGLPSSFPTEPVSAAPQLPSSAVVGAQSQPGPDNIAISDEKSGEQGNWVKKKQWLLKSFEVNNNIYNLALQIADTRNIYSSKNDAISDDLQNFYKNLGLEQGKLQEMFESVERYLDKKKKKEAIVLSGSGEKKSENDRDLQDKIELIENQIKSLKDELDQLKLDMKSIEDIGRSLNQRLEKADEQIASAMNLAETAKNKVDGLWEIIDDKKARIIYYDMANVEENLKIILTYLKNTLANDFDSVIQTAKKQIEVVNDDVKKLENKGIIIKDRSQRVEQLKMKDLQKAAQEKEDAAKNQALSKELNKEEKMVKSISWWHKLYDVVLGMSVKVYCYVSSFWIRGKTIEPTDKQVANVPVQHATTPSSAPVQPQPNSQAVPVQSIPDQTASPNQSTNSTQKPQAAVMQLIQ